MLPFTQYHIPLRLRTDVLVNLNEIEWGVVHEI